MDASSLANVGNDPEKLAHIIKYNHIFLSLQIYLRKFDVGNM